MLHRRPQSRRHGAGRLVSLLTLALLTAAGLGVWAAFGQQRSEPAPQEMLAVDLEGDAAKPMRIYGSQLTEWQEGNERVILMRGQVWVEQDLVRLCLREGIAWISSENRNGTAIYHVDIYGETADLEQGSGRRQAARAHVKTNTAGILCKTFAGSIQHESARNDPLFARALSVRGTGWTQSAAQQNLAAVPQDVLTAPPVPVRLQAAGPSDLQLVGMQVNGPPPLGAPQQTPPPPIGSVVPPEVPPVNPPLPTPPPGTTPPGAAPQPPIGPPPASPASPLPVGPTTPPIDLLGVPGPQPGYPPPPPPMSTIPDAKDMKAPAPVRIVNIRSRDGGLWSASKVVQSNGESVYVIPTSVIITVKDAATAKILMDMAADRLVFWSKDGNQNPAQKMQSTEGDHTNTMEFYLSGHVEIRNQQTPKETQTIKADEIYYDVSRNVAVAINGDVELISPRVRYPAHFAGKVLKQIGPNKFEADKAKAWASLIPSDPGLYVTFDNAVMEKFDTPRTTIFGQTFTLAKTGQTDPSPQKIVTGNNMVTYLEGWPIMYLPKFRCDADDPLGPLDTIGVGDSTIFGFQFMTTWNVFDLIGVVPDGNKKWQAYLDYFSARGIGVGTTYRDEGRDLFKDWTGWNNKYELAVKLYGINDTGFDQIGGSRGQFAQITPTLETPITQPEYRGRATASWNIYDLPNGFTFLGQVSKISDVNYLDQYYNQEWLSGLNQETYAYVKQQHDFWYWSVMGEDRIRPWLTETNWLPKADAYMAGMDLFNAVTWNTKVGAGYAQLNTASGVSPAYFPSDVSTSTARLDWWQDFSLPFSVGDGRVVPYVVTDLTYYSQDLAGQQAGRVYGGAGLRGSVPLSKLFPDVQSDLFNLDGIFHKIVLSGNYYFAYSNLQSNQLPQLDRLNDDASDQALRDIHPQQIFLNPDNYAFLTTSRLFDPQIYALQRLLDSQVDTLGSIDVLQANLNQRWQTKRGVAGDEHVVDWMTLDLGAAVFPQAQRDNFNQALGFLSYDWVWNLGDRTSVYSNGWMDPVSGGPHFWTVGAMYNRPDKSSFTLSYRQIDPLDSKAVIASITYPLSAKYAITGSTLYDFGVNTQVNTVMLTRIGTDLRVSAGFSYNSILNNVSVVFEIVPNLVPGGRAGSLGAGGGGGSSGGIGGTAR